MLFCVTSDPTLYSYLGVCARKAIAVLCFKKNDDVLTSVVFADLSK